VVAAVFASTPIHAGQSGPRRILGADDSTKRLAIIAPDGSVEWSTSVGAIHDAAVLPNGNILYQQGWTKIVEVTRDKKAVWEYDVPLFGKERKAGHGPEAFGNSVFSAIRLANGNTLIGGGNGHCVLEVTPQKVIVWKVEQNDLPGISLAWVTRVERLANGN